MDCNFGILERFGLAIKAGILILTFLDLDQFLFDLSQNKLSVTLKTNRERDMFKKTSLMVAMVFMFNSSAIFAKSVQVQFDGNKMIEQLEKQLVKEQNSEKKTDLEKARATYTRAFNKTFKKIEKKLARYYTLSVKDRTRKAHQVYSKYLKGVIPSNMTLLRSQNDLNQALDDLDQMKVHTISVLNRQIDQSASYEQFLGDLISDLKLNTDEDGSLLSNSRASIDSVPMTLIGAIVLGLAQLAFFGLIIALVVCTVIGIIHLIRRTT